MTVCIASPIAHQLVRTKAPEATRCDAIEERKGAARRQDTRHPACGWHERTQQPKPACPLSHWQARSSSTYPVRHLCPHAVRNGRRQHAGKRLTHGTARHTTHTHNVRQKKKNSTPDQISRSDGQTPPKFSCGTPPQRQYGGTHHARCRLLLVYTDGERQTSHGRTIAAHNKPPRCVDGTVTQTANQATCLKRCRCVCIYVVSVL